MLEYGVSRERSEQTGEIHLHVYIELQRKIDIKRADSLDFDIGEKKYHGHYRAVRRGTEGQVLRYVMKSFYLNEENQNYMLSPGLAERVSPDGEIMDTAPYLISLAKKGELKKALKFYEEQRPKEYLERGEQVLRNLMAIRDREQIIEGESPYSLNTYDIPED